MNWLNKLMGKKLKVGDWVNSYSKGIYRVEKIIEEFYDESNIDDSDENKIGDKTEFRTIVSKRLLNSKMKKSISYETCSEYYVSFLTKEKLGELHEMITLNPNLLMELDNYQIPKVVSIYNAELQVETAVEIQKLDNLLKFIEKGKTFLEIQNEMKRVDVLKLIPKYYGNYFFQLFNFDFEYSNRKIVWREAKLIKKETSQELSLGIS